MRKTVAVVTVAAFVSACAGREASLVAAHLPQDSQLTCDQVTTQIITNNETMVARVEEADDVTSRNFMIGTAGVLLLWPLLFAIDAKDAAGREAQALEARNLVLTQHGQNAGCTMPAAYRVADAERVLVDRKRAAENADTQVASSAPQGQPQAAPQQVADRRTEGRPLNGSGDPSLRVLMDRFLNGEIDASEYNRQRALINR